MPDGTSIEKAVKRVTSQKVDAVLFNCVTPEILSEAIPEAIKFTNVKVGGYANFWEESDRSNWTLS